jgi:hypothetical protein
VTTKAKDEAAAKKIGEDLQTKLVLPADTEPLRCRCNASARFEPLYRFAKTSHSVLLQHPATIKCGNCGQWYQWDGDGWSRTAQLDDLDLIPTNG